jgi:hypothetical protein
MQNQFRRPSLRIGDKGNLGVNQLRKKLLDAFGIDLHRRLAGELRNELVALSRDREDHILPELVIAHVIVQYLRIDLDFSARPFLLLLALRHRVAIGRHRLVLLLWSRRLRHHFR